MFIIPVCVIALGNIIFDNALIKFCVSRGSYYMLIDFISNFTFTWFNKKDALKKVETKNSSNVLV